MDPEFILRSIIEKKRHAKKKSRAGKKKIQIGNVSCDSRYRSIAG